jgi:hypothetical protein
MNVTEPRGGSLSALLVGLDGDLATVCTLVLRAAGLRVVQDGQLSSACQLIPVMQPYLVVLPETLRETGREAIDDRAIAVGAEVVWIDPAADRTTLTDTLTTAAEKAITRAS